VSLQGLFIEQTSHEFWDAKGWHNGETDSLKIGGIFLANAYISVVLSGSEDGYKEYTLKVSKGINMLNTMGRGAPSSSCSAYYIQFVA